MKTVNKTIKSFLLLLASVGMLVSCSSEIEIKIEKNGSSESETDGPEFKLVVDPIKHFDLDKGTRTSKTEVKDESKDSSMYVDYHAKPTSNKAKTRAVGSIGEDAEDTIDNVWVLQYNGTGDDAQLVSKEFITEIGDDYIIKPKFKKEKPKTEAEKDKETEYEEIDLDTNTEQTVCFIANTNNSSIFEDSSKIAILGEFKKAKTIDYTIQEELTNNGINLPMAAVYTGKPTASIKEIKLERMVAKITFKYSLNLPEKHSFEPKAVQLQECSKGIHYIQPTEVKEEEAVKENYVDYDMVNLSPDKEITWYIAENLRGTIDNIKFPHQKGGISAPEFSSNIQIYCYYSRPNPNGEIESFPALYRVYLGMDNTKSFDTKRNHHYTISAKISNVKTTDKRVVLPNVALYYFAEEDLKDVNQFMSKEDEGYPFSKHWSFGRNKPLDINTRSFRKDAKSYSDSSWWTYDGQLYNTLALKDQTWYTVIKPQMDSAPESYIGTNVDYMGNKTGDPCPNGYHIPSSLEIEAITVPSTVEDRNGRDIIVRGVKGKYQTKELAKNKRRYLLTFISDVTSNYLTALRFSDDKEKTLVVTARYLGQAGKKVTEEDITNEDFWNKNKEMDIVRRFYIEYSGSYKSNAAAINKEDKIGYITSTGASVYNFFLLTSGSLPNTYLTRSYSDTYGFYRIRCVRN